MKKTVSVLLLMLMLFACIPLYVFAEDGSEEPLVINSATLGTPIGASEDGTAEYRKAVDGDPETFWQPVGENDFVGFDLSKERNVKLQSVTVYISIPEAEGGNEATYTVQYYRNGRWYDLFTFKDRNASCDGFESYSDAVSSGGAVTGSYTKSFDGVLITQQIRAVVSGIDGSSAMPKVYEIAALGTVIDNIAAKGNAYASSFKHFEWTPPSSINDRSDFENDWHGWEPQYPAVIGNKDTSAGFSGEHVGIEFVNKEYYAISQLTFYMSMHNSYATPSMGYQNTKYKVEALSNGEWVVIAEFHDSDSIPRDYEDYDDAMANDTGSYHIPSYYTATLTQPITTNNIRVSISEFAKNYADNEELVFPYIYEIRAYGVPDDAPAVVLPEGARASSDATSLSFPYATSSEYNKYPLLAVDDVKSTGWKPSEKTAGQTLGVKFDKVYTVNDASLTFADTSINAPFKVEALVNGGWVKVAQGNVSDAAGSSEKSHKYFFESVRTDELRVVFTEELTAAPEITELSSNVVGSFATVAKDLGRVVATAAESGKHNGVKFSNKKKISAVTVDFRSSAEVKCYLQANVDGIWQTLATLETVSAGPVLFEVEALTDSVRLSYSNSENAPYLRSITVSALEDSGNTSFNIDYTVDMYNGNTSVDLLLGGNQTVGALVLETETDFVAVGYDRDYNSVFTEVGDASTSEFTFDNAVIRSVSLYFDTAYIPAIDSFSLDIVGMKTYFLTERYTSAQKTSAASGNISIMGVPYANSNYPGMSYEKYICDGLKSDESPVWVPKLEEYSAGKEIICGIKLYKSFEINKIAVYSVDVGNPYGVGSKFEIQALVNGEYVKIGDGYTCADDGSYTTVYDVSPVTTDEIRLVFTNTGVHFPTVLELELYSATEVPAPFVGLEKGWSAPAVTVFRSEEPRFEIAGLPIY